jgi:uncharacterized protein YjiS (DUF1127 family)
MTTTGLLSTLLTRLGRAMRARRVPGESELRAMTDRDLADLAIGRSEVARLLDVDAAPSRPPSAWRVAGRAP